jgi:RimJ/RimL family protein N-acetyltransferase
MLDMYPNQSTSKVSWQPTLTGSLIHLRPLVVQDFEALFSAASDPLIWEQHPDRERYTKPRFQIFFDSAIESHGALAVVEKATGRVIGSSRFMDHNPSASSVEIGYTFLIRDCWAKGQNQELKALMLGYAFQFVDTAFFVVGINNHRSRRAMRGIGATELSEIGERPIQGDLSESAIFEMKKSDWALKIAKHGRSYA